MAVQMDEAEAEHTGTHKPSKVEAKGRSPAYGELSTPASATGSLSISKGRPGSVDHLTCRRRGVQENQINRVGC